MVKVLMVIYTVLVIAILMALFYTKPDNGAISPKIFSRAAYVCAPLGGLTVVIADAVDRETASVRAVCVTGPVVSFRMRYDGDQTKEKQ